MSHNHLSDVELESHEKKYISYRQNKKGFDLL